MECLTFDAVLMYLKIFEKGFSQGGIPELQVARYP